jgi:hypothetical protein
MTQIILQTVFYKAPFFGDGYEVSLGNQCQDCLPEMIKDLESKGYKFTEEFDEKTNDGMWYSTEEITRKGSRCSHCHTTI